MIRLVSLSLVLALGACASRNRSGDSPGANPRTGTETDQTILEALHARLANERWLDLSRLNLIVSDGVVHLWGPLKSDEQQQALEVAARSVPGVRDVQNHTIRDIFANDAG